MVVSPSEVSEARQFVMEKIAVEPTSAVMTYEPKELTDLGDEETEQKFIGFLDKLRGG